MIPSTQSRSVYKNKKIYHGIRNENLDVIPSPYTTGFFDNILKNVSYGIWYVEPKNAHNFLDSLYFESQNMVSENKKFIVISNAISKIPYFSKLNINKKIYLSGFSKKIKSRITHSNFVCSNHSNWNGDFLTESDFKNANSCTFSKGQFIKSFFFPKWTPVISFEENNL
jgi:hypothetical protein